MKLKKIECELCGNKEKDVLHIHHLIQQCELKTNNDIFNLVCICSNCHNLVHHNKIKIIGIYPSTKLPYKRSVIIEGDNSGILEPYYTPTPAKIKI